MKHEQLLVEALLNVLKVDGIIAKEVNSITGPEILVIAEEYVEHKLVTTEDYPSINIA